MWHVYTTNDDSYAGTQVYTHIHTQICTHVCTHACAHACAHVRTRGLHTPASAEYSSALYYLGFSPSMTKMLGLTQMHLHEPVQLGIGRGLHDELGLTD